MEMYAFERDFNNDKVKIAVMLHEYTGAELFNKIKELCAEYYTSGYDDCTTDMVWEKQYTSV
jgi:hypothetical protein